MVELKTVIYYEETNELEDLGIETDAEKQERLSRVSVDLSKVIGYRETFMDYKGQWRDAVVVYFDGGTETPPLLVHYDKFKKMMGGL